VSFHFGFIKKNIRNTKTQNMRSATWINTDRTLEGKGKVVSGL